MKLFSKYEGLHLQLYIMYINITLINLVYFLCSNNLTHSCLPFEKNNSTSHLMWQNRDRAWCFVLCRGTHVSDTSSAIFSEKFLPVLSHCFSHKVKAHMYWQVGSSWLPKSLPSERCLSVCVLAEKRPCIYITEDHKILCQMQSNSQKHASV